MSRIDPALFDSPLIYHRAGQASAPTHLKHTLITFESPRRSNGKRDGRQSSQGFLRNDASERKVRLWMPTTNNLKAAANR
jgi:hypothetical protein